MKTIGISIFIFNLICIKTVESQVTWFPVGAKWHYEFGSMLGSGLTTLEVLPGDTLPGDHPWKRILSTTIFHTFPDTFITATEMLYVREENKVVYGFDNYWEFSFMLYDFNAAIGDTLGMLCPGLSYGPFIVDSIGQMEFNGSLLAFQDIQFPNIFDPEELSKMRVFEGMGSIQSHLFHDHTILQPFDAATYFFRCYEDENIGLVNLSFPHIDCNYIDGVSSVDEEKRVSPSIFPNPADDFITIRTEKLSLEKITVADILGSTRIVQTSMNQEELKIDVSPLENGFYFILGEDKNGEILFVKKFTKYGK